MKEEKKQELNEEELLQVNGGTGMQNISKTPIDGACNLGRKAGQPGNPVNLNTEKLDVASKAGVASHTTGTTDFSNVSRKFSE